MAKTNTKNSYLLKLTRKFTQEPVTLINMLLSFGNLKLPVTTAIFNITAAVDCPAKRFCPHVKDCYALKSENRYPKTLEYHRKQTEFYDLLSAEQLAKSFILAIRGKKHEITKFRFSEAGDFRNQNDVDKMTTIASMLKEYGLMVYGYSARPDLDFSKLKQVATVNGNHFECSNHVKVVSQFSNTGEIQCKADCRLCDACATANGAVIEIIKH